jgi:GAF domain-containing protein
MVDTIVPPATTDRAAAYAELFPQVQALLEGETDVIAAMSNTAAALFQSFWSSLDRLLPGDGR